MFQRKIFSTLFLLLLYCFSYGQLDSLLPVRGLAIAAPASHNLDSFLTFVRKELAPNKINTLILRVDYNFQYTKHPELTGREALSLKDVKKIVTVCRENKIMIIPQVNLLGHQSWANQTGKLLTAYPEFDETPGVKMPEKYQWTNEDGLYCKSYCPLHPKVHEVVFEVVDEICNAFEATAFHAGMDEVFYIGEEQCPRCAGRDKAELFAEEVRRIRDHLAQTGRSLWIWGDRLIDGKTTDIGMWEGSYNNTFRAVDMIPKDVVICDWHYERPEKTAVYFAMKGLSVVSCPWRKPQVALQQIDDMIQFRKDSNPQMKNRFLGVVETVWSPVTPFLDGYYGKSQDQKELNTAWNTLRALFNYISEISRTGAAHNKSE